MGTELDRRGVRTYLPLWSAFGLIDAPDTVRAIHADYVMAGADVITTNTFRTTGRTLAKAGLDPDRAVELDRLAVRLARDAADDASRDVFVAGSIAPLEDCYSPWLMPERATARAEHELQARSLDEAGVDFIMIETMPCVAEAAVAAEAAAGTGLPLTVGFVLGADGRLLSGETLDAAVAALSSISIDAIFLNCAAASVIANGIAELSTLTALPIGGYANAGSVDDTVGWEPDDTLSGAKYAADAAAWLDFGARVVGGCCGTRPEHIASLRSVVDARQSGTKVG